MTGYPDVTLLSYSLPQSVCSGDSECVARSALFSSLACALPRRVYAHHLKQSAATIAARHHFVGARLARSTKKAWQDYENLYLERCNDDWRAAVKEDPNLAVAWAWIAFNSSDPKEVSAAREKAKALAPKLTPGEQLMIAWIVKVQEGDYIGGISAMNDMLEMYPKDKHLFYLAGNWLMGEERRRSGAKNDGEGAGPR